MIRTFLAILSFALLGTGTATTGSPMNEIGCV